jgi:hypothetical protein
VFGPRERRVRQLLTEYIVLAPVSALRKEAPATALSHFANRRHVSLGLVLPVDVYTGAKQSAARNRGVRFGVAFDSAG